MVLPNDPPCEGYKRGFWCGPFGIGPGHKSLEPTIIPDDHAMARGMHQGGRKLEKLFNCFFTKRYKLKPGPICPVIMTHKPLFHIEEDRRHPWRHFPLFQQNQEIDI
jgi:hypothetical protein